MKKALLLLLIVFGIQSYAAAPDLHQCDVNNSGVGTFDLTVQTPILLNGLSPNNFTVSYHETLTDATTGSNQIVNAAAFSAFSMQMIYARIESNTDGTFTLDNFALVLDPAPVIPAMPDVTACSSYILPALATGNYYTAPFGTGSQLAAGTMLTATQTVYVFASSAAGCYDEASFFVVINAGPVVTLQDGYICPGGSYVLDSGLPDDLIFMWFYNDVAIAGETGNTLTATQPGNYALLVQTWSTPSCTGTAFATIYDNLTAAFELTVADYTLTINGVAGNFTYTLDGVTQTENSFSNLSYGTHSLTILDECGNVSNYTFDITTPDAPEGETSQTFNQGQTLADVIVEGQGIQWYANANGTTDRMLEANLPLSTVLTDNTTYYASQTINGIESANRLPVHISLTLGLQNNTLDDVCVSPNPVKNVLGISNGTNIDRVAVFNLLGQLVSEKKGEATTSEVDFSGMDSGIYLVKIQSGINEKTVRIVKN